MFVDGVRAVSGLVNVEQLVRVDNRCHRRTTVDFRLELYHLTADVFVRRKCVGVNRLQMELLEQLLAAACDSTRLY